MQTGNGRNGTTRRTFLAISGGAAASCLEPRAMRALGYAVEGNRPAQTDAAKEVVLRVLPAHASQIDLELLAPSSEEFFRISGSEGKIHVQGSTTSALLCGVHWYLKYVAGVSVSWNGDCVNRLPARLPGSTGVIQRRANGQHRFALNDTNDGYTGPYWKWQQWEHLIDVLALNGINEVLVYLGAESVYQRCFNSFRYNDAKLCSWFPTPAHQPWWLLENCSGWVGPSVPQHLIDARLALAQKITARLRALDMQPVLPGYFGIVPDGFAELNAGAHVIAQGEWLGLKRPDWLDPTSEMFSKVAQVYYRAQQELLGPARIFKMDPLHEGGRSGGVSMTSAASAIERALQESHPGATWAILGWLENPRRELLDGLRDKSRAIIFDGQSDRYAHADREQQWANTPYTFGTIWNFGGHTTMGANAGVWNERYFAQLKREGSKLSGIAVMPEASCNNPAAFAFMTELPWRSESVELNRWFTDWAAHRYGGRDPHAAKAWQIVGATAYDMKSGKWSEAHDNLFSARPSLTVRSACRWSPEEARYDLDAFSQALPHLLNVDRSLRNSSAYRYDLVDVARQTIANRSRVLLPLIEAAYKNGNLGFFRERTQVWLKSIDQLNRLGALEPSLLLGRWIASARRAAINDSEEMQFEFDACSLLLEWGPESSRDSGVHDYANREWNGLLEHYRERWANYFSMLDAALAKHEPLREIDWFAIDQDWARRKKQSPDEPSGDVFEVVKKVYEDWKG